MTDLFVFSSLNSQASLTLSAILPPILCQYYMFNIHAPQRRLFPDLSSTATIFVELLSTTIGQMAIV